MMPKFYYYILVEELAENPYTSTPAINKDFFHFISIKRLWGDQKLIQGAGISLYKGFSHNSRSYVIQKLHRQALKMKMSSPGTRSANFSYQCCPALPTSFFKYLPLKLKMIGT